MGTKVGKSFDLSKRPHRFHKNFVVIRRKEVVFHHAPAVGGMNEDDLIRIAHFGDQAHVRNPVAAFLFGEEDQVARLDVRRAHRLAHAGLFLGSTRNVDVHGLEGSKEQARTIHAFPGSAAVLIRRADEGTGGFDDRFSRSRSRFAGSGFGAGTARFGIRAFAGRGRARMRRLGLTRAGAFAGVKYGAQHPCQAQVAKEVAWCAQRIRILGF